MFCTLHQLFREWPTWLLLLASYGLWGLSLQANDGLWLGLGILGIAIAVTLHSSLCHEALHGHPTPSAILNGILVFPQLGLSVPYLRFKDTHLAHHQDEHLTDPYDDPESNFYDPAVWHRLAPSLQGILRINNTLLGRMVIGPLLGHLSFYWGDLRLLSQGDRRIWLSYGVHVASITVVISVINGIAQMPVWGLILGTYAGHSILKIRTFLEHRAHEKARARTVIIEDRGPLALLFLNNNLHVVHHMHPQIAWYNLWQMYHSRRAHYHGRNEAYVYRNYAEIFRDYFLTAKDPVPHPLREGVPSAGSNALSDPLDRPYAMARHQAECPLARDAAHLE